ncbi:MAG: RDD family protein [Actinomycetota bacterium]
MSQQPPPGGWGGTPEEPQPGQPQWGQPPQQPPQGYPPPPPGYPPQGQPPQQYPPQGQPQWGQPPQQPPQGYPPPPPGYPPQGQPPPAYPPPPPGYGYQPGYAGQAPGYGPTYAEWWRRAIASLIDGAIFSIPGWLIGAMIGFGTTQNFHVNQTTGQISFERGFAAGYIAFLLLSGVAPIAYYTYFHGKTGQTLGKMALRIKIIGAATGAPIGYGMALARYFCHIIDAAPCSLGYLWPIWDERKQTFTDKVLKTYVINV